MKIFLVTDLEGVAGVRDFDNWCVPEGRYYDLAKQLLTAETNAAIEGFFEGGATEILVLDGHGCGGIDITLLDSRVELSSGWPCGWPFNLDRSFDSIAWVGQHAKAGTECAHLPHTQSLEYVDLRINNTSIGEFGQLAMCASELGVRSIFGSGDEAFTKEVQALVPGIETVWVKRGVTPGSGNELPMKEYERRNLGAVHLQPVKARALIREGAKKAVERARSEDFGIIELVPPYERLLVLRATDDAPRRVSRERHPSSVIGVMNMGFNLKPQDPSTEESR